MPLFSKQSNVKELTPQDFSGKKITDSKLQNKKGLIFFGASWCGFCERFSPVYENASNTLGQSFPMYYMDCEKYGDFASKTFNISGFPTVMYIDRTGVPYKKYSGDRTEASILQDICSEAKVCQKF